MMKSFILVAVVLTLVLVAPYPFNLIAYVGLLGGIFYFVWKDGTSQTAKIISTLFVAVAGYLMWY